MELKTNSTINIGYAVSLLGDIFGFNSPIYLPYSLKDRYALNNANYLIENERYATNPTYNLEFASDELIDRMSQFGTPVLGTFWASAGVYKVYNYESRLINKEFGDFEFPIASIIDFSRQKNIIKTPTIGSVGTVKEIYGLEDWKINIRGICMDDNSRKSQNTMKEQEFSLMQLNEIAGSIQVKGRIFEQKHITRMTIEALHFTPIQGNPNIMQYEIEAVSDEDFLITEVI